MAKKKERRATVEDLKDFAVEPVKDVAEHTEPVMVEAQREDSPFKTTEGDLHPTGPVTAREVAEEDKKDTPEVDIEEKDGKVVAVEKKREPAATWAEDRPFKDGEVKNDDYEDELAERKVVDEEGPEESEAPAEDPEVARLEEEIKRLKAEIAEHEKCHEADHEEIERLNKEILESPAEKLRAELEVSKRENEVLIGSVQKPPKQIFG